jgi:hypothetical protein
MLSPGIGSVQLLLRDADGHELGELDRIAVPAAEPEKR